MSRTTESSALRCGACQLPLRWCVCPARIPVYCPLGVDVFIHHREWHRPSSTGNLITRLMPDARRHLWRRDGSLALEELRRPGRELWILHPHGRPAPARSPEQVQVVLLDGSWSESADMARQVARWGRLVSLPMAGESRYWLRAQQEGSRFSTVEALLFLLQALRLDDAHAALRVQFELHVYATLRARGQKQRAQDYLDGSPLQEALPEFLAALHTPRPREIVQQRSPSSRNQR